MRESEASLIQEWVARLEVVLQSEEEVYGRLKGLLRREESELIALDPRDLSETLRQKGALAEEARLHEESRVHVAQKLASLLGLDPTRPKLSVLVEHLGDDASGLRSMHGRLSALVESTRSLMTSNERFATRSLARVQETLRLLGQAVPEEAGYGPSHPRVTGTGRGRLVRAAI